MKSNTLIKLMLAFLFATLFTACGDDEKQKKSSTYDPYGLSGTGNMRLKKITTDNSTTQYYYESTHIKPKIIKIESTGQV